MTQQLNLFPESPISPTGISGNDQLMDQDIELSAVDEIFATGARYRHSYEYIDLLKFISRFPNYSPFNCFLLFIQNPSISYVATARTWNRKFKRRPKINARPMVILAPMGPVRFIFDIKDTEGLPVEDRMLEATRPMAKHLGKVYANTLFNCSLQAITVHETAPDHENGDTATRITPALRKKYKDLRLKKDANYLIIINPQHSLEEKYASLVYELGHIFCGHLGIDSHAWWSERQGLEDSGEEVEAESTAFLVCRRIGLYAGSEKYLAHYTSRNQQLPVFSLNAVLQAANYIEEMGRSRWKKPKKRGRY